MKSRTSFLFLGLGLAGCGRQPIAPAAATTASATTPDSVVGTWQLTALDCYCPAGHALPNQRFTLNAKQEFQFYSDGKLFSEGTYALGTGSACSATASSAALLQVTLTTPNAYAPHGNYTLRGDSLIIDQCLAADAPRYTFRRQQ